MKDKNYFIIVKANIRFLTPAEGGRTTAVKTGYRPDHVFEKPKDIKYLQAYMGDINFDEQEFLQLGETKTVTVRFLRNEIIEKFIKVGQRWFIHEGPRLVGEGEIIEV